MSLPSSAIPQLFRQRNYLGNEVNLNPMSAGGERDEPDMGAPR